MGLPRAGLLCLLPSSEVRVQGHAKRKTYQLVALGTGSALLWVAGLLGRLARLLHRLVVAHRAC